MKGREVKGGETRTHTKRKKGRERKGKSRIHEVIYRVSQGSMVDRTEMARKGRGMGREGVQN